MQTNLIGQYVRAGWNEEYIFNEIVATFLYHGELHLITRNPDELLGDYVATSCVVVAEKPKA